MSDASHAVPGAQDPAGPPDSESERREQDITKRNDGHTESTTGDIPGGSTTVEETQYTGAAPLHRPGEDEEGDSVAQGPMDPAEGPVDQAGEDPPGHVPGEDEDDNAEDKAEHNAPKTEEAGQETAPGYVPPVG